MGLLQNHVALVTGAAKRIGKVLALALAESGANVAITYRDSEAEATRTVAELRALGIQADAFQCNVRSPDSIRQAVAAVAAAFGRIDILVNNAGIFETAALESITVPQWDAMFETNTRGPFLVSQAAYPHLKAALHMLTATMSKAFAPEMSVNCVAPGMIATNGNTSTTGSGQETAAEYEHFAQRTPMRRNGTPQDVAEAVLFFATGPHFITGQILGVDGGLGL